MRLTNNPALPLYYPNFLLVLWGRMMTSFGAFVQSVTIGWQVYSIARLSHDIPQSSFLVGMVGLAQFLPLFALTFLAGETADRYDRRKILLCCSAAQFVCAGILTVLSFTGTTSLGLVFAAAALFGASRSFMMPASSALMPMLIPREILPRAIAWNTLSMQAGMILGPWLGGILCGISQTLAYGASMLCFVLASCAIFKIDGDTKPQRKEGSRLALIREGLAYVWSNKIVFGAISLDLFAVLLGGVTSLLPVFARDILHIGADGFGLLRSGTAIGAGGMTILLSMRPIRGSAGVKMLSAVFIFGIATIVFALSKNLVLSMLALMVLGAADAISVFVRQSLVQIVTPDAMRGRVAAVSSLFISASNELGEFESGVIARFLGPIGSAIFGGLGSMAVVAIWARLFPALRKADRLE